MMTQNKITDVLIENDKNTVLVSVVFDDGTKGSIPLKENEKNIVDEDVINRIKELLNFWGNKKSAIANQYVSDERMDFAFLYDLIALAKSVSENPDLMNLAKEVREGTILMHNRISTQIISEYSKVGYLANSKIQNSTYDFDIDVYNCEVKTIQVFGEIEQKPLGGIRFTSEYGDKFFRKIQENFNKAVQQVRKKGVIFIAPWSYKVNALLSKYFEKQLWVIPPPLDYGLVVLILPTTIAFQDLYVPLSGNIFISSIQKMLTEIEVFGLRKIIFSESRVPLSFRLTTSNKAVSHRSYSRPLF